MDETHVADGLPIPVAVHVGSIDADTGDVVPPQSSNTSGATPFAVDDMSLGSVNAETGKVVPPQPSEDEVPIVEAHLIEDGPPIAVEVHPDSTLPIAVEVQPDSTLPNATATFDNQRSTLRFIEVID